jgi:hypothetical protein
MMPLRFGMPLANILLPGWRPFAMIEPLTKPIWSGTIRPRSEVVMGQEERRLRRPITRRRLTEKDVAQVKAHLQQGKNPTIIARYFEVDPWIIYCIRAKKTYRHIAPAANATPLSKLHKTKRRV